MLSSTETKVKETLENAEQLGWIKYLLNGKPYIHAADVEKLIIGLLEPDYINNLKKIKKQIVNEQNTEGNHE